MALVLANAPDVEAVIVVAAPGVPIMMAVPLLPVRISPALILVSADHVPEPSVRVMFEPDVADGVRVVL